MPPDWRLPVRGLLFLVPEIMGRDPSTTDALGFPPPLLGPRPLRLPILARTGDWLALDKPAGVAVRNHPWDADRPDLDGALNRQLQAGKPELLALGAEIFGSVYYLDTEVAGPVLFARSRAALAVLRNAFGSGRMRFEFRFVARAAEDLPSQLDCATPLLPHRVKPKMIPSTAKGKQARTRFRRVSQGAGAWSLWAAEVGFFRPHQVRVHAALAGLGVLGDAVYDGPPAPRLRELRPGARGPGLDKPAFEGPAIRLSRVEIPAQGSVAAPPPRRFERLRDACRPGAGASM